jgi:GalNAc-alpha-(1->4)-GalNAc-alpha-(1->3)-diNAcBac-PP-undecaprenol alpha-1,4-N-acetyl-D-galactosaminyltransferase
MSEMINFWAEKHRITLIILNRGRIFYDIHPSAEIFQLLDPPKKGNLFRRIGYFFELILSIRRTVKAISPDFSISFITTSNVLSIIATRFLGIPIIISERSVPWKSNTDVYWKALIYLCYRFASSLVLQSDSVENYFVGKGLRNTVVIENPVREIRVPEIGSRENIILSIGRLAPLKGHSYLVEAFAKADHHKWKLVILGEGPERGRLEAQIRELDLQGFVELPGAVSSVDGYLARSAIFAMTSSFEGFPNALCEAMVAGIAPVAFDCPVGPKHIIQHNQNGFLVALNDVDSLTENLNRLMCSLPLRKKIGAEAMKTYDKLNRKAVMSQWEGLLQ